MSTVDLTKSPTLVRMVGNDPENLLIAYAGDLKDHTAGVMAALHTMHGTLRPDDEAAITGAARLMASVARDMDTIHRELYG